MKERIKKNIKKAIEKYYPEHKDIDIRVDYAPANIDADFSSNVSSVLGKRLDKKPMDIAVTLAKELGAIPVAPVFLNFRVEPKAWIKELEKIVKEGDKYGSSKTGKGQKINLESVSANPTGPLTVGHGRGAVIGLVLSNILESQGYKVVRDYYYNDGGLQMKRLGESVQLRVREQLHERLKEPEPMDIYLGAYIGDIAAQFIRQKKLKTTDDITVEEYSNFAAQIIFSGIKDTLHKLGIAFDNYFNELALFDKDKKSNIWEILEALEEKGAAYKKDGATWLKAEPEDRVLVRSTGEPTYRLPDIAYHVHKLKLGYEKIINILGADHIAQFPDIKLAVKALGYDERKIQVIINQFVTLAGGRKMSTRKAEYVTLDELISEVGPDVTKFFMLMSAPSTHMNFDMDLAKDTSEKNPVFRVQYAHARINSILKKAKSGKDLSAGLSFSKAAEAGKAASSDFEKLVDPLEIGLIRELAKFPELVSDLSHTYVVHQIPHYLLSLADRFHSFYEKVRVIGDDEAQTRARLMLVEGAKQVIGNGLRLMGIEPLEKM